MKYSEFVEILENKSYQVDNFEDVIGIRGIVGHPLCTVEKTINGKIDVGYSAFFRLYPKEKIELLNLIGTLVYTPLEEREDEKWYRLRLPFVKRDSEGYLNLIKDEETFTISDWSFDSDYQTIFTESEITELKRKYNLDSFVMEEVENVE